MIKKAGEVTPNKKMVLDINGPPGVGKTTLALSALNPVLIDSDGKSEKTEIEHYAHVPIISFSTIPELKQDLQSDIVKDCDTIVLDTAGSLITYLSSYAIQVNPNNGLKDGISLNRKGWGFVKNEFINLIDYFRITLNKHVIIICHVKETIKKIDGEEDYWFEMDVPGSSSVFIEQKADLMCMMEMYGPTRTLGFSPTRHYKAKSAYGIKGIINVPELKPNDSNDFLTTLFSKIDNYRKSTAEKAKDIKDKYESVMKEVRSMVKDVKDQDSANKVMKDFKNIDFPYNSRRESWILLKQKAESVGLRYDSDVHFFVFDEVKENPSLKKGNT